jgi:hypothetical protein
MRVNALNRWRVRDRGCSFKNSQQGTRAIAHGDPSTKEGSGDVRVGAIRVFAGFFDFMCYFRRYDIHHDVMVDFDLLHWIFLD